MRTMNDKAELLGFKYSYIKNGIDTRVLISLHIDVNSIQEYANKVEAETNEYLEKLTDEKLQSVFEFKGRDGKISRNKIEDILMHVIEEEIHHRGEILCIYWQRDIQPPYISYTTYKGQA